MEYKLIPLLRSLVLLFLAISAQAGHNRGYANNLYSAIYYGDSKVNVGQPFQISCQISVTDPIQWYKDGELIKKHNNNLRHNKDAHSFIETESGVEGDGSRIEATISVKKALPRHEGKYQCNKLHTNYHTLYINKRDDHHLVDADDYDNENDVYSSKNYDESMSSPSLYPSTPFVLPSSTENPFRFTADAIVTQFPHTNATPPATAMERAIITTALALTSSVSPSSALFTPPPSLGETPLMPSPNTTATGQLLPPTALTTLVEVDVLETIINEPIGAAVDEDGMGLGLEQGEETTTVIYHKFGHRHNHHKHLSKENENENVARVETGDKGDAADQDNNAADDTTRAAIEEDNSLLEDLINYVGFKGTSVRFMNKNTSASTLANATTTQHTKLISGAINEDESMLDVSFSHEHIYDPESTSPGGGRRNNMDLTNVLIKKITNVDEEIDRDAEDEGAAGTGNRQRNNKFNQNNNENIVEIDVGGGEVIDSNYDDNNNNKNRNAKNDSATNTKKTIQAELANELNRIRGAIVTMTSSFSPSSSTTEFIELILTPTHKNQVTNNKANLDQSDAIFQAFDIRQPLVLACNLGEKEVSWYKNTIEVSKVQDLSGRYKIMKEANQFVIDKTLATDDGIYECRTADSKKAFRVIANVAVKLPSNTAVVEGEKLSIPCTVVGTKPIISWTVGNETYTESRDRFVLEENEQKIQNAILIIESASMSDRGDITCNVTNESGKSVSDTTYVRVKGKLAALWPFIGICAEVFVLCAIILIYEKRRNKTELDESDTDQSPDQKNDHPGKDSDVRHRK